LTLPLVQVVEYGLESQREQAAGELEELGRRALRPLLDALASEDLSLRGTALRILGGLRHPNAALPVARLLDEGDDAEALRAAVTVARIADPRAVQPLLRAVEGDDQTVRLVATWALGRTPSPEAATRLVAMAADAAAAPQLRALAL